jgi:TonB family protein
LNAEPEPVAAPRLPRNAILAGAGAVLLVALAVALIVARPRRAGPAQSAVVESQGTVTQAAVDLRREPAADAPTLERLSAGARVTVAAERGRWLEIRSADKRTGFVPQEAVETDSDRDGRRSRAAKVFQFPAVFGVVAEETDVLLAPFPMAPHAGRLQKGETIRVHAVDHDYYAFRASDGGLAFVRSADVDLVPPDPRRPAIVAEGAKAPRDVEVTNLSPSTTPEAAPAENGEPESDSSVRAVSEVEPATLASKVEPKYPEAARRAGVEGTVLLDATIDESGAVTDLQVLRGLPLGLSEAAVEAVSRWKYRPARGRAGPVTSHKTIRIVFRLGE